MGKARSRCHLPRRLPCSPVLPRAWPNAARNWTTCSAASLSTRGSSWAAKRSPASWGPPSARRSSRSRSQVRDYVIHKFDDDLPPAELAGAQAAYRLFGLIPDSLDLRRSMIDLLTEQVAGYFDPDSNALYI